MNTAKLAYATVVPVAVCLLFAVATFRPVKIEHNGLCPFSMGGGNDRDYPMAFTTNGDVIDYHYPEWWERWYSRGGIVIDRIQLADCNNFRIHYYVTRKEPVITLPPHGTATIPVGEVEPK